MQVPAAGYPTSSGVLAIQLEKQRLFGEGEVHYPQPVRRILGKCLFDEIAGARNHENKWLGMQHSTVHP